MSDDSEDEWAYSIDEVGEDGDADAGLLDHPDDGEETRRRIEPGSPIPENVLFVALGVLIAVGTIVYGLGIL